MKRDGSSYKWTSLEHPFVVGELVGTLVKEGFDCEPGVTLNADYTAAMITVRRYGKTFRLIVAEVE